MKIENKIKIKWFLNDIKSIRIIINVQEIKALQKIF